jgi:hypothetical protein
MIELRPSVNVQCVRARDMTFTAVVSARSGFFGRKKESS